MNQYQLFVPIEKPRVDPSKMADHGAVQHEFTEQDQEHAAAKTGDVLHKLIDAAGWVHSKDLIPINHRFSAAIYTLRSQGHVIENRRSDSGGFEWRYVERRESAKVGKDEQAKYYRSAHWKRMRQARLEHDGHRCCNCKCANDLEVHHWRYDLFEERLGDLMTLCRNCHERIHDALKERKPCKFPSLVPKWIHDKIDDI